MDISFFAWLLPTVLALGLLWILSLRLWARRRLLGELSAALFIASGAFLVVAPFSLLATTLLVLLQGWLVCLAMRLAFGRLEEAFVLASTRFNLVLAGGLILLVLLGEMLALPAEVLLWILVTGNLLVALLFVAQAIWTLKHYKLRKVVDIPLKQLPTVTLAIPARNETHALTECLTAAVASDYPKLEILVLDDCSQDTTSSLIRSFAHDGVRFIQGEQPATGWLGKNQAFQALAEHASGDYILFAGVDTHLDKQSISQLIDYALSHTMQMVSVLPQRRDGLSAATVLWQLRYFWQIVLPVTRRRVPVASQAWLIKADTLRELGGFAAVRHKIVPEGFFARRLFASDTYRFLVSNSTLGITTAKRWSSQTESGLRFLYPTFKRQPLFVLIGLLGLAAMLAPLLITVGFLLAGDSGPLFWASLAAWVLFMLAYLLVVVRTVPRVWLGAWLFFAPSLVQELFLLGISMLLYEFGEVNWKGRNVCYPVMLRELHRQPTPGRHS